jgi:hypothetical protein
MAFVEWTLKGVEYGHCNCATGCPCQFNSLPTHGNCRAHSFFKIERGRFGDVALDGLAFGFLAMWPGPIHMGGGTCVVVIEERANPRQRAALEAVTQGKETEPGTLITQVFSLMITRYLPTIYKPIDLSIDISGGRAHVRIPGLIDAEATPIKNPMTGAVHRVSIQLPEGMEFREAEFVTGRCRTDAASPVELTFDDTHAHLAPIHWSTHGLVR